MSHSKEIIIKCPACEARFEAEREVESIFVSCPDCDMQVKISGMGGSERRKARTGAVSRNAMPASSIPVARHQERVQIGDLSAGKSPIDFDTIRVRKQVQEEDRDLVIDEDEESEDKPRPAVGGRSSIERRAAKLEERAAKLEERAAKLGQMKVKSAAKKRREETIGPDLEVPQELEEETKPKPVSKPSPEPVAEKNAEDEGKEDEVEYDKVEVRTNGERRRLRKAPKAEVPAPRDPLKPSAEPVSKPSPEPVAEKKAESEEDEVEYDKVEVRTSGERRRLRKAPKAEVPAPRGTLKTPKYVENLRTTDADLVEEEVEEGEIPKPKVATVATEEPEPVEKVEPTQDFEERQVSEGAEWRRHNPSRVKAPDWEGGEEPGVGEEEFNEVDTEEGDIDYVSRRIIVGLLSVVGLFALFACFQFILSQAGWLKTDNEVSDAPPLPQDHTERWSRAEMLENARPVIDKFLASQSNEEALQYVRRAGKIAFLMKNHYAPSEFQPVEIKSLGEPQECHLVLDGFFVVPVTMPDFSSRGIALEVPHTEDGDWLVDWESWVGYSEMDFREMRLRQPKDPVLIRCTMVQDEYYNYAFSDSEKYLSFKLIDQSGEEQLWGYVDKLSDTFSTIDTQLIGVERKGEELVTLRVQFQENPSNAAGDQVEITDILTFGWVLRD